jgi:hypothetical protein
VPRHPAPAALDGQVGQPLLSAVVEVALDAPAGLVGGGGDPGPRRGELRAQLGVVEGDRELRGDEVDRVQPVGGERVVDAVRDLDAGRGSAAHHGGGPVG